MSQINLNKIGIVILAGGKGTRLNCTDRPKVMLDLNGKPIVEYVVDTLRHMGFEDKQICLVVGFKYEVVEDYFGDSFVYALQEEQLGTGHAVMMAEDVMKDKFERIVVLYGDSPFITEKSILEIIKNNIENKNIITMTSIVSPNYEAENARFFDFGRVVRNAENKIVNITEKKDCTEEQLQKLQGDVVDLIHQIKKAEEEKNFPTNVTGLCSYCVYKSMCPSFKHQVEIEEKPIEKFKDDEGVQFVDESGNITFDKTISPDGRNLGAEALSFYSLFSKETDLTWNKEWVSAHDAFVSGKLAMMFGPSWRVYNLLEANKNLKLKVATVPQIPLGDTQTTDINWATYWAEAVSKTAKDQATAWDFLKYMTQREQMVKVFTIASEKRIFGEPYSRQDLYSTLSSDPYLAPYVKSAKTATSFSMCDRTYDSIFNDEIVAIFKDEIIKINDGTLTAEAAIKDAADRVKVVYTNVVKK